ncbi:NAD-dependent epimerase/dehydratase family protein [Guptibacillus hwajinpoensis]|uniref:UDP-glucose epimerase n=1 Tax=Guptibacillus hwajinpoensis TaxID=208199 RepID=A0A0J6D0K9_9BACL|nr:NAD-dependent epimerase/dehydratase family protein [Alkalihalobacillus macyae]KMM38875.1 UDP-glucose epimerase [Alkalihalobacillus macyae]
MNILITGIAGFIGSHLGEELLAQSDVNVIGIDQGVANEPHKFRNIENLLQHKRFQFYDLDLLSDDFLPLLNDIQVIYHLAGIPGVRSSWGDEFETYLLHNGLVTQKLLEACRRLPIDKFIYISTSSVYGEKTGKVSEDMMPIPLSPYGITKLTGEQLCRVYHHYFDVPVVVLRYFTVYGPRQRPDMAFHRFIKQLLLDEPLIVYGDGKQTRDFTYVKDCVKATASVATADHVIGETINIGGKERASVLDVITLLEQLLHKKAKITFVEKAKGEPVQTWANISKAEKLLNYEPTVSLKEGLKHEIEDLEKQYKREEGNS